MCTTTNPGDTDATGEVRHTPYVDVTGADGHGCLGRSLSLSGAVASPDGVATSWRVVLEESTLPAPPSANPPLGVWVDGARFNVGVASGLPGRVRLCVEGRDARGLLATPYCLHLEWTRCAAACVATGQGTAATVCPVQLGGECLSATSWDVQQAPTPPPFLSPAASPFGWTVIVTEAGSRTWARLRYLLNIAGDPAGELEILGVRFTARAGVRLLGADSAGDAALACAGCPAAGPGEGAVRLVVKDTDGNSVPLEPAAPLLRVAAGATGLLTVEAWIALQAPLGEGSALESRFCLHFRRAGRTSLQCTEAGGDVGSRLVADETVVLGACVNQTASVGLSVALGPLAHDVVTITPLQGTLEGNALASAALVPEGGLQLQLAATGAGSSHVLQVEGLISCNPEPVCATPGACGASFASTVTLEPPASLVLPEGESAFANDATSSELRFACPDVPAAAGVCTFTQGGYGGTCPHEPGAQDEDPGTANPACFLQRRFALAFPQGLSLGTSAQRSLRFSSAAALGRFLPAAGPARALSPASYRALDPLATSAGAWLGQLLAARLSVGFSDAGLAPAGLGERTLRRGDCAGYTVRQLMGLAEAALWSLPAPMADLPAACYTPAALADALMRVNRSYLACQGGGRGELD